MARHHVDALVIGSATPADLDAICEIEQHSFAVPRRRASFAAELTLAHARLDVARVVADGPIVGFSNTWHVAGEVELLIIAVSPEVRRRGVGAALLEHVLALAGAARVMLEVRANNVPAQALYESAGFVRDGLRPRYYNDGVDAVLMSRPAQI